MYTCKIAVSLHAISKQKYSFKYMKTKMLQLSLFQQILKNPDVFCFADYPYHAVGIDVLKAPPENDNKEIATWYKFCDY